MDTLGSPLGRRSKAEIRVLCSQLNIPVNHSTDDELLDLIQQRLQSFEKSPVLKGMSPTLIPSQASVDTVPDSQYSSQSTKETAAGRRLSSNAVPVPSSPGSSRRLGSSLRPKNLLALLMGKGDKKGRKGRGDFGDRSCQSKAESDADSIATTACRPDAVSRQGGGSLDPPAQEAATCSEVPASLPGVLSSAGGNAKANVDPYAEHKKPGDPKKDNAGSGWPFKASSRASNRRDLSSFPDENSCLHAELELPAPPPDSSHSSLQSRVQQIIAAVPPEFQLPALPADDLPASSPLPKAAIQQRLHEVLQDVSGQAQEDPAADLLVPRRKSLSSVRLQELRRTLEPIRKAVEGAEPLPPPLGSLTASMSVPAPRPLEPRESVTALGGGSPSPLEPMLMARKGSLKGGLLSRSQSATSALASGNAPLGGLRRVRFADTVEKHVYPLEEGGEGTVHAEGEEEGEGEGEAQQPAPVEKHIMLESQVAEKPAGEVVRGEAVKGEAAQQAPFCEKPAEAARPSLAKSQVVSGASGACAAPGMEGCCMFMAEEGAVVKGASSAAGPSNAIAPAVPAGGDAAQKRAASVDKTRNLLQEAREWAANWASSASSSAPLPLSPSDEKPLSPGTPPQQLPAAAAPAIQRTLSFDRSSKAASPHLGDLGPDQGLLRRMVSLPAAAQGSPNHTPSPVQQQPSGSVSRSVSPSKLVGLSGNVTLPPPDSSERLACTVAAAAAVASSSPQKWPKGPSPRVERVRRTASVEFQPPPLIKAYASPSCAGTPEASPTKASPPSAAPAWSPQRASHMIRTPRDSEGRKDFLAYISHSNSISQSNSSSSSLSSLGKDSVAGSPLSTPRLASSVIRKARGTVSTSTSPVKPVILRSPLASKMGSDWAGGNQPSGADEVRPLSGTEALIAARQQRRLQQYAQQVHPQQVHPLHAAPSTAGQQALAAPAAAPYGFPYAGMTVALVPLVQAPGEQQGASSNPPVGVAALPHGLLRSAPPLRGAQGSPRLVLLQGPGGPPGGSSQPYYLVQVPQGEPATVEAALGSKA